MSWGYKPYVSVAKRRERAQKKMAKLKKQGHDIQPVQIEGKKIATTFWGNAWCSHIESFSDYENRLPRGRTYVRNGSVCHLSIEKGSIIAIVSGSELYHIVIKIKPITDEKWISIKNTCSGKIASILDLLSGKLTSGVMDVVCHQSQGLFPLPHEITLACDCPDWADMCKHIAAVLYGLGARLDADPAALFKLRGVNYEELIDIKQAVVEMTAATVGRRKRLAKDTLSSIFDVDMVETPLESPLQQKPIVPSAFPKTLTGTIIRKKRTALGLTKTAFAKSIGVSPSMITLWEAQQRKKIQARASSLEKLRMFWESL